jgi:hypothetical protein
MTNPGWQEPKNKINKSGKLVAGRHSEVNTKKTSSKTLSLPLTSIQKEENPYQAETNKFLRKHAIKFGVVRTDTKCPLWCDGKHTHGNGYRVSFSRGKKRMSVSFWNSKNDASMGKDLTAYDVIASIQKYDPGDIDNFISEFGYERYEENGYGDIKPNKKTRQTYNAVVKEWEKVNSFFSEDEIEEMREIS